MKLSQHWTAMSDPRSHVAGNGNDREVNPTEEPWPTGNRTILPWFLIFHCSWKNVPKYENSLLISNSTSVSYQKVYRQTAFLWLWVLLKSLPKKDVITGGWEKFHFLSWDPSTFEFGARNGQPLKSPLFHVSSWFCWLHIPFHFPFLPDNTGWNKAQLVVKGKKLMFLAKFWRFMLS